MPYYLIKEIQNTIIEKAEKEKESMEKAQNKNKRTF